MPDPPPYQYPRHLTNFATLPGSEITLEPAATSTFL